MLKGERFHTVIGNPWEIDNRSWSNSKSNGHKGENLKILTNGEHPEIVEKVNLVKLAKRGRDEGEDEEAQVSIRPTKRLKNKK